MDDANKIRPRVGTTTLAIVSALVLGLAVPAAIAPHDSLGDEVADTVFEVTSNDISSTRHDCEEKHSLNTLTGTWARMGVCYDFVRAGGESWCDISLYWDFDGGLYPVTPYYLWYEGSWDASSNDLTGYSIDVNQRLVDATEPEQMHVTKAWENVEEPVTLKVQQARIENSVSGTDYTEITETQKLTCEE